MAEASRVSMNAKHPRHADRANALETLPDTGLGATSGMSAPDHFVEGDGMRFAGTHLIVDLWDAINLDDGELIDKALREAADKAGATLLSIDLHRFTPNGGISGVAVLAESHISIHTWPERAYAAIDVFMCGEAEPHRAIDVLRKVFAPGMLTVTEHKRGVML